MTLPVLDLIERLSIGQRAALRNIAAYRFFRRYGEGYCAFGKKITKPMIDKLVWHNLARINYDGSLPELEITGLGSMVLDILDQRAAAPVYGQWRAA